MQTLLRPYREILRPLLGGATTVTDAFRHNAIKATLGVLGIDPKVDGEDSLRVIVGQSAARLLVNQQAPMCLPRIKKDGLPQKQLTLLNETFEFGGEQVRLGFLTPNQAEQAALETLIGQRNALNSRIKEIRTLIRRCRRRDIPIIDQL
jgi:hypothetical protein